MTVIQGQMVENDKQRMKLEIMAQQTRGDHPKVPLHNHVAYPYRLLQW